MQAIYWYKTKATVNPIKTKAISGSIIFFLGDIICQSMEVYMFHERESYDLKRACIQGSFGFFMNPYTHYQFNILIPKIFPINRNYSLVKSILYSVTINDAIYNLTFFIYMGMMRKRCHRITLNDLPEKFIPVQIANMKIYPFITGFNFYFIPANFRVLFDNITTIFWNVYLSYVEHEK
jgi:protein Mpv17